MPHESAGYNPTIDHEGEPVGPFLAEQALPEGSLRHPEATKPRGILISCGKITLELLRAVKSSRMQKTAEYFPRPE